MVLMILRMISKDGSLYLVDPKNEFTALNSFIAIYTLKYTCYFWNVRRSK